MENMLLKMDKCIKISELSTTSTSVAYVRLSGGAVLQLQWHSGSIVCEYSCLTQFFFLNFIDIIFSFFLYWYWFNSI